MLINSMTPEQFTYWLQGFAEISGENPSKEEWQIIKDHLALVFEKKTPDRTVTTTTKSSPGQISNYEFLKTNLPQTLPTTIIC